MKRTFSILGVTALVLLVLAYCQFVSGAQVYQPTRAELLAPTGLMDPHQLVTSPEEVAVACNAATAAEVKIDLVWLDKDGVQRTSQIPCLKIDFAIDPTLSSSQITFVFDQLWLDGQLIYMTIEGGEQDVACQYHGELGMYDLEHGCGNAAVQVNKDVVTYRPEILADPNNFLKGRWLQQVVISVVP